MWGLAAVVHSVARVAVREVEPQHGCVLTIRWAAQRGYVLISAHAPHVGATQEARDSFWWETKGEGLRAATARDSARRRRC